MHYLMTSADFYHLLSLSETTRSAFSPVQLRDQDARNGVSAGSGQALEKVGLVTGERLTAAGKAITAALLAPERVVQTVNTALSDNAPVSYCEKDGYWTVLAPEMQQRLVSIFSPVLPSQVAGFAAQNLLHGRVLPSYQPFELVLTVREALVLQLTQLVIAGRAGEKGAPLVGREQWFSAAELFTAENLAQLVGASQILAEESRESAILTELGDARRMAEGLVALVTKGVLTVAETSAGLQFAHSAAARTWLLADTVLDRVLIQSLLPARAARYYRMTRAGVLSVRQEGESIYFASLPELELDDFGRPA